MHLTPSGCSNGHLLDVYFSAETEHPLHHQARRLGDMQLGAYEQVPPPDASSAAYIHLHLNYSRSLFINIQGSFKAHSQLPDLTVFTITPPCKIARYCFRIIVCETGSWSWDVDRCHIAPCSIRDSLLPGPPRWHA
jgi:hypothetical protein